MSEVMNGPLQGRRHRLLVAVDFGTTHTGVAYCLSNNISLSQIETITTWPGSGANAEKVPTDLLYIPGQTSKWGSEASGSYYSKGASVRPDIYSRFKLLLDPSVGRDVYGDLVNGNSDTLSKIPLPPGISAIQLSEDYLHHLYIHIMENTLKKRMPETLRSTPIEFIFTVPAIWSHKAQEATYTAASRAGFGVNGRLIDTISMISEPEAAAVYSLSAHHEDKQKMEEAGLAPAEMRLGDHFIVCDAGGGTVDLITYQVVETFPDLKLRESAVGGGGKCGSTYIDEAFHQLLRRKIGPSFDDSSIWTPRKIGKGSQLMQTFERCKRTFGQEGNDLWFLELPVNVPDNEKEGIIDNELELSSNDMKGLFDPIVGDILRLVAAQAQKVEAYDEGNTEPQYGGVLTTVILVGGFGESQYLYDSLKAWGLQHNPPLTVINPPKSWSAIVRGAVLQALHPSIATRKLRNHYGFQVTTTFDPSYHKLEDAYLCIWNGGWVVDDNVEWTAHLGDDCSQEKEIEFNVFYDMTNRSDLKNDFKLKLLGSRYHDAPRESNSEKVYGIGTVDLNFTGIGRKKLPKKAIGATMHYKLNCTVKMRVGSAHAEFSVWIKERCFGRSRISYND